jgi:hypothetical protein
LSTKEIMRKCFDKFLCHPFASFRSHSFSYALAVAAIYVTKDFHFLYHDRYKRKFHLPPKNERTEKKKKTVKCRKEQFPKEWLSTLVHAHTHIHSLNMIRGRKIESTKCVTGAVRGK